MNSKELNSFKLSDAVTFHDHLNPKLFRGLTLKPEVDRQLKIIAEDFISEMGIGELAVTDITISGSNAAYSYTKHSDLDLHVVVDMSNLPDDEVYREFFAAKKTIYNDTHDITINGIPVELYIQDSNEPVVSVGEYSVLNDKWIRSPSKRRANFDQNATRAKYEKLMQLIELGLKSNDINSIQTLLKTLRRYRQAGLDKGGEFGPENLAYKALRSQGLITKLYALRDKLHSNRLSIEGMYATESKLPQLKSEKKDSLVDKLTKELSQYKTKAKTKEDYDPNGIPPGPEFKPTMPRGTVRVDVSDVYDWYKLGQNISDLDRVDPKIFGKGPPSTIVSFGDEDEEHKYINKLKNLGLATTDIDPVDPKQPKNMPRQKVDPTYNVNEGEEIHNYSKLDNILHKLCNMVVKGQSSDNDYGMVAACVLDPDNNIVAGLNSSGTDGKRVHAERVAIEKYENKYGKVPEGSIVITTLSPCNEHNDETAEKRMGDSCTDYLNSKGIEKVYCGYMDPTQDNDNREFNIIETSDKKLRHECKKFADTFLKQDVAEASGYIPSEKEKNDPRFKTALTVDVHPYTMKKGAKKFGWNISRAGIPPLLR